MNHRATGIIANPPGRTDLPAAAPLLDLQGVGFTYPNGQRALQGLDLQLRPGILGLLGPNGAGKSTLMRMLATLTRPTCGRILWNGVDVSTDPDPLRARLGYLPQEFGAYPALSAREFLRYLAAVKGIAHARSRSRVDECLALVGLGDAADRAIGSFSGGMRQRVGIAQALLNDPALLIVDEPTVGLDPEERLRFRDLLTDLAGERLVILSTHIVPDIEASASSLAVIDRGRLRFHGSPEALLARAQGRVWEATVGSDTLPSLRQRHLVCGTLRRPDGVRVRLVADQRPLPQADAVAPGLEDAYLDLLARES